MFTGSISSARECTVTNKFVAHRLLFYVLSTIYSTYMSYETQIVASFFFDPSLAFITLPIFPSGGAKLQKPNSLFWRRGRRTQGRRRLREGARSRWTFGHLASSCEPRPAHSLKLLSCCPQWLEGGTSPSVTGPVVPFFKSLTLDGYIVRIQVRKNSHNRWRLG